MANSRSLSAWQIVLFSISTHLNTFQDIAQSQLAIIGSQSVNLFLFLFAEMWYQIFLWCLATSVFIHCVSAGVAFFALRQHSRGMFFPLLIIFIGFLYPVTGGIITSEFIFRKSTLVSANNNLWIWRLRSTLLIENHIKFHIKMFMRF